MNWFERHLNWTAVGIAIISLFFTLILIPIFANIFSSFPFTILLPATIIYILACFAFSIVSHGWILFKKKRRFVFLIFYLPALLLIITAHIVLSFITRKYIEYFLPSVFAWCYFSTFIILAANWIILLMLKNHSQLINTEKSTGINLCEVIFNLFSRFYTSSTTLKYTIFSIMGVILIVVISCFLFLSYGHLTYQSAQSYTSEIPVFTFEYPPNYHLINNFQLMPVELYSNPAQEITIETIYDTYPTDEQTLIVALFNRIAFITPPAFDYPHTAVQTTVDSIPATCVSLSIKSNGKDPWGFGTGVFFKRENTYWLICYIAHREITDNPPPYFTHLLESFKFLDN
jgi:hypothetical protein